ncbi:proton-associated sugar transporter A [Ceratitis capitata]|uniref:proton-associated sugar transporter A n=1 Tax=Ceratitis capitata TaxID=7213 RepID=UPI00032A3C96|nr:proton-associated sugar transporter A [Ceratitis capitata]XP_020712840.1 proton-associated sugar transporter A [Ceratitis capitata]XP_020712841.1 proton-associated sugar transporter A [Ceratitis capitata]
MVGVAAGASEHSMSSTKNPMIKYMLKTRENHARNQKHDYSHVFRVKTRFEMFRLAVIAMAIEFAYAAETSFVSPILLQIGIDHKLMTMAWGVSPIIGFFISPLLGSISDRCTLNWGRRRPIITFLSVGILLGLILVPYGQDLGILLGDIGYNITTAENSSTTNDGLAEALISSDVAEGPLPSNFKFAAILTILGMVLLDLNADTCQTPARTYMLDVCIPEDQARGLTTFSLLAGFGGTIGYAIGGVDWEKTQFGVALGGNIPTVFGMVTIIFIICFFITITTFREIPLKLIERDEMLKPLSAAAIKKELCKKNNDVYYIKETDALELQKVPVEEKYDAPVESYQNGYSPSLAITDKSNGPSQSTTATNNNTMAIEMDECVDTPITLAKYLKSIFVMPKSMRILALTNLLCWMGHVTYCLYFTDFVGEAVFNGDPTAMPGTESAQLYESGIRFGCWGMSVYALSCSIYSISVTKLRKLLGTKVVYIAGISYYGIGMLILAIWPTKWGVIVFSTSAGILYGTIFTIPYILVANYHAKDCFRMHNGESVPLKQARGLGTDVAIISSMVFIAQLIISLSIGPLISWMQTTCAILYASTFLAFFAAISAMFVLYV